MNTIRKIENYLNNLESFSLFADQFPTDPYWAEKKSNVRKEERSILDFLVAIGVEPHKDLNGSWKVAGDCLVTDEFEF
jgi:hypothetical protein